MSTIQLITGPMFAGKTEELLRRFKKLDYVGIKYTLFKPALDKRYSCNEIVSHDFNKKNSHVIRYVSDFVDILKKENYKYIGIDEGQFLTLNYINWINHFVDLGIHFIIAALDLDYKGEPFEFTKEIMPFADEVTKLKSVCDVCKTDANRTYKIKENSERLEIGGKETYLPLCRTCYNNKK